MSNATPIPDHTMGNELHTLMHPEASLGGPTLATGTLGLTAGALILARKRVNQVALTVTALMICSSPFQVAMYLSGEFTWVQMQRNLSALAFSLIMCGVVVWAGRSSRFSDSAAVWVGLTFEVLFCMGTAYGTNMIMFERTGEPSFMTWVTPMVLLFPLLVPVGPRVVAWVGLLCATTEPLSLWALSITHGLVLEPNQVAILVNPVLAVAVAWFSARSLHRLQLDLRRARQLGSYQLIERLGEGGMGEVWIAKHAMLARPAAIKLVHASGLGDQATANMLMHRFEQEAQATASLRSPHTVQLYDFGRSNDGAFYIVMELLDGLDLQRLVEKFGPQPPARVVHILRQACHSLAEAHAAGLVHRDVKPANIFLCRYGLDSDVVKVLDFGLVKGQGDAPDIEVTRMGMVPGTPAYLSPEAAHGQVLDGRADLYALGCVAYYLLTGCLVFTGETPVAIVARHITELPIPPSKRTELAIPLPLEQLVMSCLAKDPNQRPASAVAVSRALDAIASSDPWTDDSATRWWRAHLPNSGHQAPRS